MPLILSSGLFLFWLLSGTLFLLYAEVHYKFKGIYSRLKIKAPEILADVPHRIEPGNSLPILVLFKDADKYPVYLQQITVKIKDDTDNYERTSSFNNTLINIPCWSTIIELKESMFSSALVKVDVLIQIRQGNKTYTVRNDNYIGTNQAPFSVVLSGQPLPKTVGWHYGDFHCHTMYTSDQVEFGAPPGASRRLAKSMGLSYFCATDHSYDLDDEPDNYLRQDPGLRKWWAFQAEVRALNEKDSAFQLIPGEEVSVGNSRNQNVHMLVLNNADFLPGAGDSAEKWLQNKPTLPIEKTIQKCSQNSAIFAAHPAIRPGCLERLLIRRGHWQQRDYEFKGLHGLQIWNGSENGFEEGRKEWIRLLLTGRRVFIAGGNDAHGNFNRFRQIGFPFLTVREHHENLFGVVKTAVFTNEALSVESLISAIKLGRMIVTDGPFLELEVKNEKGLSGMIGERLEGNDFQLRAACKSTKEFGEIKKIKIFLGDLVRRKEEILTVETQFPNAYETDFVQKLHAHKRPGYLRAEAYSEKNGARFRCLTNPIWLTIPQIND